MATTVSATTTHDVPARKPSLLLDFRAFLDKYGVLGLAIAFVIGQALTQLVQTVVAAVLMPLVNPALALLGEDWRSAEVTVGSVGPFLVGQLVYATIYFLIIALFVFLVAKMVLREESVAKR